jgi:multiple antibiotic resistance protein
LDNGAATQFAVLFFEAFVAIFVALDIIGAVPTYVNVTVGMSEFERRKIVNTSMGVAFGFAIAFLFLGETLFRHLGITLFDFKIAGGVILLLISLADLIGQAELDSRVSGKSGIVPLAVPLITGPGLLATIVLQAGRAGYLITITAMIVNYVLAWFFLRHSPGINRVIGKDGTVVISKIAALLLAAYAVSMIRSGVFDAIVSFRTS